MEEKLSDAEEKAEIVPTRTIHINPYSLVDQIPSKVAFSKPLIDCLIKKWKNIFNVLLRKHKDVASIDACMDTESFTNCHGVKFNSAHFCFNRLNKEFSIRAYPKHRQDVLWRGSRMKEGTIGVYITHIKLRGLFTKFFERINRIYFCSDCGSVATHYYEELGMCEACLFEEIASSQKVESILCPICQEEGKRLFKTKCGHHFHRRCLVKIDPMPFLRCPVCREPLESDDDYDEYDD
jgi:hypothetical protein